MPDGEEQSLGKRAAKVLYSTLIGKVYSVLAAGITFIVVARLLGPAAYGAYTFALGFSTLLGSANHFGIGTYFNKYISEYLERREYKKLANCLSSGYAILLPVSVVLSLMGIALSGYLSSTYFVSSEVSALTLALAAATIAFFMLYGASYSALVGFSRGGLASIVLFVVNTTMLVLSVAFVLAGFGANGAIAAIIIANAVGFLLGLYYVYTTTRAYRELRFNIPSKEEVWNVLKFALPVAANNMLTLGMSNFAVIFLGLYVSNALLGNYGTAAKGFSMMMVFYGTLTTVLIPTFSAALARRTRHGSNRDISVVYNKVLFFSMLLTVPIAVYIAVFARPLIFVFITAKYAQAPLYLSLIAIGMTISMIGTYTGSLLVGAGRILNLLKYTVVASIAEFAAILFLVPRIGALGNIFALFFVGSMVSAALNVNGVRNIFGVRFAYKRVAMLLLSNLFVGILLLPVLTFLHSLVLQIVIGAAALFILYPLALVLLRAINSRDIDMLGNSTKRIPVLTLFMSPMLRYVSLLMSYRG